MTPESLTHAAKLLGKAGYTVQTLSGMEGSEAAFKQLSAGGGVRLLGVDVESAGAEPLRARYVRRPSLTLDLGVELVF